MSSLKILALAGSTRDKSFNKMMLNIAIDAAKRAGADVTRVDLRDFPLPIYDGDLEDKQGMPDNAKKLRALFVSHQGVMIASPEYNSSISGVLKNAIDWISRPLPGDPFLVAFTGKTAAIMSASMGALGGLRGLVHMRAILGNLGMLVLPTQVSLPLAQDQFSAEGHLKDAKHKSSIEGLATELVTVAKKLM